MAEIRMPKMGDGMEEGTILRWLKKEGDAVTADEPIAEIETDKANVEIPAEEAGTLTQIVVKEGETVPVGAVIAQIGAAGAAATQAQAGDGNGARPSVEPQIDRQAIREADKTMQDALDKSPASPAAERAPEGAGPEAERVKASPLARKMAREMGIDLAQVQGSGPGGRIVERDIQSHGDRPPAPAMPTAAVSEAAPAPPAAAPPAPALAGQDVDISRMRKTIARRTVQSKQTIPHFYLTIPIEMDRALKLRERMNAATPELKLTVNDLVVKACAVALGKLPEVNVSYTPDDKIRRYEAINIGVAVGTENGLTIPVIVDCGKKTLREISSAAKALVGKARAGSLTPQEMSGGTFSVSNLGMFGIEEFAAIISPPESAILAVGAAIPEVLPGPDGDLQARQRMRVTLSCDHRAVDGVLGARFLQEVKRLLENPFELVS